ncbi:protein DEHYDRATION-INDUCED 19-like [Camellia sinensis]|uniref:protein DEHYDRATION-INDUCED 19-like n=1 Tax=Camellia sinensis TaxID=4442 RepID=UPI001036D02E|nr:protein DEHYDRATION-INDUCED 19-like [Camellia sinensis]
MIYLLRLLRSEFILLEHADGETCYHLLLVVCPICSIKVVSDMLSHITLQHGHLFKMQRRRRLRRVAIPNSQALSLSGRDLREAHLQVLLGGSGYRSSNANSSNAVIDPFLSSLILNFPSSESEDISKSVLSSADDSSIKSVTSSHIWKAR